MLGGFVFSATSWAASWACGWAAFCYDRLGNYDIVWLLSIALGVLAGAESARA